MYQLLPHALPAVDNSVGQYMFTITWLLHDFYLSPVTELAIRVMDRMLIDTPTSLLHRLLMEIWLGEDVIGHGMDTGLLQGTLEVGMRGVRGVCVDWMEAQVMEILGNTEGGRGVKRGE